MALRLVRGGSSVDEWLRQLHVVHERAQILAAEREQHRRKCEVPRIAGRHQVYVRTCGRLARLSATTGDALHTTSW